MRLFYFLTIIFCISFTANAKINIFACESEWASLTREITKDKANIYIAVNPTQDAHYLQARPSLINQARKADFLICNGADLEIGWLDLVIKNSRNNKIRKGNIAHFLAADHVKLLDIPTELDRKLGDVHISGNPHIHLNPNNLLVIAAKLTESLTQIDPENNKFYQKNLQNFTYKLKQKLKLWKKQSNILAKQKIVVIHKRYVYLLAWLNLEQVATIEELPGISPSLKHLKKIERTLADQDNIIGITAPFDNVSYVKWLRDNSASKMVELAYSPKKDQDIFSFYQELIDQLVNTAKL